MVNNHNMVSNPNMANLNQTPNIIILKVIFLNFN